MALVITRKKSEPVFIECGGKLLIMQICPDSYSGQYRIAFEDPRKNFKIHRDLERFKTSLEERKDEKNS